MNKREDEMWEKWGKQKLYTFCLFRNLLNWTGSDDEADYFKDLRNNEIKLHKNARVLRWSYKLKNKEKFIGKRKADTLNIKQQFYKLGIVTYDLEYDEDTGEVACKIIPNHIWNVVQDDPQ